MTTADSEADQPAQSETEGVIDRVLRVTFTVVAVVGGFALLLFSVTALWAGGSGGLLSALLFAVGAVVLLPQTRSRLEDWADRGVSYRSVIAVTFILFFAAVMTFPAADDAGETASGPDAADVDADAQAAAGVDTQTTTTTTTTTTETPTTTTTTTTSDAAAIEDYLVETLRDEGFNAVTVDATSSHTVYLVYYSWADTQTEMAGEIGTVAGAYVNLVEYGYDPADLHVTVVDTGTDDPAGEYRIEREWADAYLDSTMSQEEYLRRIMGSIET